MTVALVVLRFWAGARAAAGVAEETVEAGDLAAALDVATERHGAPLRRILSVCSFVVNDQPVGNRDPAGVALPAGAVVDVLPPFAGG